jgi:hypothetical protein
LVFWQVDFNLDTWQDLILKEGFLTTEPTVWLFEGLIMYLTPAGVANLVETVAKVRVLPVLVKFVDLFLTSHTECSSSLFRFGVAWAVISFFCNFPLSRHQTFFKRGGL